MSSVVAHFYPLLSFFKAVKKKKIQSNFIHTPSCFDVTEVCLQPVKTCASSLLCYDWRHIHGVFLSHVQCLFSSVLPSKAVLLFLCMLSKVKEWRNEIKEYTECPEQRKWWHVHVPVCESCWVVAFIALMEESCSSSPVSWGSRSEYCWHHESVAFSYSLHTDPVHVHVLKLHDLQPQNNPIKSINDCFLCLNWARFFLLLFFFLLFVVVLIIIINWCYFYVDSYTIQPTYKCIYLKKSPNT